MIQISMIPQEVLGKYNLKEKLHNGYIFTRLMKGVYGLPQSGKISHDALVQHLEPYGYHPSRKTSELWTHGSCPIYFTLLVNDFGGKVSGKRTLPTPESRTGG